MVLFCGRGRARKSEIELKIDGRERTLTLVPVLLSGARLISIRLGGYFERDVRVDAHTLLVLPQIRNFHTLLGLCI